MGLELGKIKKSNIMKENGNLESLMAMEFKNSKTAISMKANTKISSNMAEEKKLTQIRIFTLEITSTASQKALGNTNGPTGTYTRDSSEVDSDMARESSIK